MRRIIFFSFLAGCAHSADYTPTNADTRAGARLPASFYEVQVGGTDLGQVKVWSEGGKEVPAEGMKVPTIRVGMRLRNTDTGPLTLDVAHSDLEVTAKNGNVVVLKEPAAVEGDTTVASGDLARVSLVYVLPQNLKPDDVEAFELNWLLDTPKGPFSRSTPFVREVTAPYGYYPGYYGPWAPYGPWGPWDPWRPWWP
jgi:hypothetical protein